MSGKIICISNIMQSFRPLTKEIPFYHVINFIPTNCLESIFLKCTGVGLMVTYCPYTGPSQIKTIAKIQHITRPKTLAQKNKYILDFADKQCQNESIVGGKGYSLAILTSIITDDVCT